MTDHRSHSNVLRLVWFRGFIEKFGRNTEGSELKEDFDGKDDPDPNLRGDVHEDGY